MSEEHVDFSISQMRSVFFEHYREPLWLRRRLTLGTISHPRKTSSMRCPTSGRDMQECSAQMLNEVPV